jgi:hypothetical protein
LAVHQHQVFDVGQLHARQFGQIGNALHRDRQARAALQPGGEDFGQQLHAAVGGNARGGQQAGLAQGAPAQQQGGFFARAHGLGNAATVASSATGGVGWRVGRGRAQPPSPQDTSAGRIRVATWPGRPRAAATGLGGIAGTDRPWLCEVRTKPGDTLRATVSMSLCSCASYCVWVVAWSPTILMIGVLALRALCRLARPLPSPQPKCKQCGRRFIGHAGIAIGGASGHPFKQCQHSTHLGLAIQCGHESAFRWCRDC